MILLRNLKIKVTVVSVSFFLLLMIYLYKLQLNSVKDTRIVVASVKEYRHNKIVKEFYDKRKNWNTSVLGSMLFKKTYPERKERDKTFHILVWKHWRWLKRRFVYYFGFVEHDPLEGCSVQNCKFTGDDNLLNVVDAVVVHLQKGLLPKGQRENLKQKWIFMNDESPLNTFMLGEKPPVLTDLVDLFNWSMTYRVDSDIPVPYGRIIPLQQSKFEEVNSWNIPELVPNWEYKRRDTLVALLMSGCFSSRINYINELKKHIKIDIYGKCSDGNLTNSCPGYIAADCKFLDRYLFYLVFENSLCKDYMSEKLFHHAYTKGAIPVIRGPPLQNCDMLPPKSFLHVDNFETPEKLAEEMFKISNDEEKLMSYHAWRNDFEVINEHGYFGTKSYHLCRLCEAMNYNDENETIYDINRLESFLNPNETCAET